MKSEILFEAKSALGGQVRPRLGPSSFPAQTLWDVPCLQDHMDKQNLERVLYFNLSRKFIMPISILKTEKSCWKDIHSTPFGGDSRILFELLMCSSPFTLQNLRLRPRETGCFFKGDTDRKWPWMTQIGSSDSKSGALSMFSFPH